MITEENIEKFLSSLGSTPEAIAKSLKWRGIKGTPKDPVLDPVAIALKDWFGCPAEVACPESVVLFPTEDEPVGLQPAPEIISQFSLRFDRGEFVELIK